MMVMMSTLKLTVVDDCWTITVISVLVINTELKAHLSELKKRNVKYVTEEWGNNGWE